ncbi:hypothetical protein BT93_L5569 [Corymbia citriodora subsp. variegata]|uniref:Methyltransferase domain-containing protein n=1 Tax=Corymbia citriodora subsp. variegata TaxID=360336 RepID=A0A8T0CH07_CORYI|nr:hypothetical protein BT93_L5569 [Corymbia citriodora subsp. variegata]
MKAHSWRSAQNSCQFLLPTLQKMVDANPTLTLLDVGCGIGSITASLAQLHPSISITASDISPSALAPAKALAASRQLTNITFAPADVTALPFADATFDVVHAQQLLGHLSDPVKAVREMLRVTKPGGAVALRECDLHTFALAPLTPELQRWHELLVWQMDSGPGDGRGGRLLKKWCLDAGVDEEKLVSSAGTWCHSSKGDREAWGIPWVARTRESEPMLRAVREGKTTHEELLQIAEAWEKWMEEREGWLAVLHGEALIHV